MANNASIKQALAAAVLNIHEQLGIKTYCTTDGFRHALDYRVVATVRGEVVGDLCSVDRHWFDRKRTNKEDRDERDAFVAHTVAGIKPKGKP